MDPITQKLTEPGAMTNVHQNVHQKGEVSGAKQHPARAANPEPEDTFTSDAETLLATAGKINAMLQKAETHLQIEIHRETNTPIFKIVDSSNDKVIQEIPPRELLNLEVKIRELAAALFDHNA